MADEMIGERDAFEAWWRDWQRGTWDASIDREMPAHWNEDSRSRMKLAYQAGRASLAASAGSEPVAEIGSAAGDDAEFGQRAIYPLVDIDHFEYGTKLYTHPSPPEGMAGWKPLTDAPKDGTEFLAVYGRQGNVQQIARWNTLHGHWESKGNWLPGFESNVTAIHPLPAPPLPASEAKEL